MRVGACVPEISHAIPSCVLQLLKSKCWNSAVFEMLVRSAVRELHAKLVRVARRVLLHAATLLRARGACPATVLLRAAPARPLCSCVRRLLGHCAPACGDAVPTSRPAYSAACPADCAAASRAAFLARVCASTSSGVRGPCVVPSLSSVRSHEMARLSRAPKRAR